MSIIFSNGEGREIRKRRKALGLKQLELAKKVGCSHQLISKIEKGELWNSKLRLKVISALEKEEKNVSMEPKG